ncbi:MAG TPA: hypothetical protein VMG12_38955 [Polyangiaceae bacterium]|nr:hypothetical protein [Polyangiaceae bacterium]
MNNERPDGQSVRDLLEAALAHSLGAHPAPVAPSSADAPPTGSPISGSPVTGSPITSSPVTGSPVVVGEILDTHHPHLPGRVLVRWYSSAEAQCTEWLHHERHLTLVRGDRVLVTLPLGWAEWLVTGALGRAPVAAAAEAHAPEVRSGDAARLQLEPGQALVVIGHDGQPLLQVRQAPEGLQLELARDQVELKARRRLRLSADSIEIAAGPGGVDVRTDGDAVTRARAIRLN